MAVSLTYCAAACGPDSFNLDAGNAVSERELAIVRGTSPCSEVYLHRETYTCVHELSSATWSHSLTPFQVVMARPGGMALGNAHIYCLVVEWIVFRSAHVCIIAEGSYGWGSIGSVEAFTRHSSDMRPSRTFMALKFPPNIHVVTRRKAC